MKILSYDGLAPPEKVRLRMVSIKGQNYEVHENQEICDPEYSPDGIVMTVEDGSWLSAGDVVFCSSFIWERESGKLYKAKIVTGGHKGSLGEELTCPETIEEAKAIIARDL